MQDVSIYNYQLFLCGLGYNTSSILVFTRKIYVPRDSPHICRLKLHICHPQSLPGHNSSDEAVTNVGSAKCVYRLVIHAPASIQVFIALWNLTLKQKGETLFHHSKACSHKWQSLSFHSNFCYHPHHLCLSLIE
jgi:hypothetical protein